jgi:hypothetical protein
MKEHNSNIVLAVMCAIVVAALINFFSLEGKVREVVGACLFAADMFCMGLMFSIWRACKNRTFAEFTTTTVKFTDGDLLVTTCKLPSGHLETFYTIPKGFTLRHDGRNYTIARTTPETSDPSGGTQS